MLDLEDEEEEEDEFVGEFPEEVVFVEFVKWVVWKRVWRSLEPHVVGFFDFLFIVNLVSCANVLDWCYLPRSVEVLY